MQESEFVGKTQYTWYSGGLSQLSFDIYTCIQVHALHKLTAISNTIVVACLFVFILITWPYHQYHNTTKNINI